MANQPLSDEEIQLRRRARRRLIGAVTLVTVIVVTLPMLLDGEPKQSGQDIVINIPPQTSAGDFSAKTIPLPEEHVAKQAPMTAPALAPRAPAAERSQPTAAKAQMTPVQAKEKQPEAPPAAQSAKTEERTDKKPATAAVETHPKQAAAGAHQSGHNDEKPAAARHDGGPFVIQLGAFSNTANAKERQARLTALKIKFYTETVKSASGDKLRVRAGPFATRQEAERAQAKLKASGIQDGVVAEKKG